MHLAAFISLTRVHRVDTSRYERYCEEISDRNIMPLEFMMSNDRSLIQKTMDLLYELRTRHRLCQHRVSPGDAVAFDGCFLRIAGDE